jgi:hypothetical protein
MMGLGKNVNTLYLIDFGLVKKVSESAFGDTNHGVKKMAGTPIYASINAHMA